ncbi:ImmA/IrrE family metallo-endopeptidase [Fusicatenibacter sp. CLA-AA-H213]|nr:ImmA/IrrE family metallo-endopeptidase [Fusicatenibacter sp. CLA-AA-H213]
MNNSLAEVHPELVSEWSEKNLTLTPDDITFGLNKKVWWRGACGHEWQASVKARSNGEKCPICSGARVIAGINDLATLEPLLVKQWSKKNKIKPIEVSIGSHKKVIWRCEKGHEWEAAVKSRTINKTDCPYCSHNKVLAGFNDLATLLPDIAAEWSDRNYPLLPTQVTVFANRKAWWKCKDCGREWNTLISTRSGGSKCPYCSGYIFMKGFNDLQTTHPEIASEWSEKNLPLKPDEVNAKSRKNVWWKCRKCGNEWKSVVNARVKGTVCPVCAEREVLAGYNDLATTAYANKFSNRVIQSIDIEHFITEFLMLRIEYAFFAEDDAGRIGFLADGATPLLVHQDGKIIPFVFPKDTIVLDKFLLAEKEQGRRRFTMAHEASHHILSKMYAMPSEGRFHAEYDSERSYSKEELAQMFASVEWQADTMGASLLMPRRIVENALAKYNQSNPIKVYGDNTITSKDKAVIRRMAAYIGVSYTALVIRLRDMGLFEYHNILEYISNELNLGGVSQ